MPHAHERLIGLLTWCALWLNNPGKNTVMEMSTTTFSRIIMVLRSLFPPSYAYGLPEQVVTDNGPQFESMSYSTFMHADGVKAPYHPSSNGAAEWFVRTFKESMKAVHNEGQTTQHSIANFLLTYWSTLHSTIGVRCNALFTVPGKECKDSAGPNSA